MTSRTAALLSNDLVYAAMAIFALAFLAHAIEVAWSVKAPVQGSKKTKLDFDRTTKAGRIGTAMMILAFILLFVAVVLRGISAERVPWGNMYEFSIT
jgi:ABC-type transport system involved in cytochrome c biogenesis permease subunit